MVPRESAQAGKRVDMPKPSYTGALGSRRMVKNTLTRIAKSFLTEFGHNRQVLGAFPVRTCRRGVNIARAPLGQ